MECEKFEKFIFENPEATTLNGQFSQHIKECEKCEKLWEIQNEFAEFRLDQSKINLPLKTKSYLLRIAKNRSFEKFSRIEFIEDTFIFAIVVSTVLTGIVASFYQIVLNGGMQNRYIKMLFDFIKDNFSNFATSFSSLLGKESFVFLISVFLITFSLSFFFRVLNSEKKNIFSF